MLDTLVLRLGGMYRVLSSAPGGGGLVRARSILNHQVAANPMTSGRRTVWASKAMSDWQDPARFLGALADRLGVERPVVGLMTAVPMTRLVHRREEKEGIWVECFCTVGVANAVRAGEPVRRDANTRGRRRDGTINIILVTNATLTGSAMVGAVQVATESKTAVLIRRCIPSAASHGTATGTGTDAVVVASNGFGGHKIRYSGTHTQIGSMIGRLVARCVEEGLTRWFRWRRTSLP
ncbi:putative Adenosylcobinamide amidohydrolase [Nitrospira japonica]|uniref:Putative Adenosylcobinamide amidohydrolase n=1 Tax=Nitrospira japonica TaxID=1325564 RepID=A0A1W1I9I0_9BACT|nr:putative Adenosylcobinamide amidohydrolase [Nitrospira japonica]